MIVRPCRCRFLSCVLLVVVICTASSLHAGAASRPFDTAMELVASNDWETALYALDLAVRELVGFDEMLRAMLWKALILRGLISDELEIHSMLVDGCYAATGSDKSSFERKRKEVFNLAADHVGLLLPVIDDLVAKEHRRAVALSITKPCQLPPSDLDSLRRKTSLGLYPGDHVIDKELRVGAVYAFASVLSRWTRQSEEAVVKGMLAGNLACEVDMAALLLDLGLLLYPTNDTQRAVAEQIEISCGKACLEKAIELTKTDPYCNERLEALRLLGR